jgi:hypothetical protein
MEIVRTEHTFIKETYVSIDKRVFDCKNECIDYEKWLETNSRNIPTKEQFDALKEGEQVLYRGRLFRLDCPPNKYGDGIANIDDGAWSSEEVYYLELDLIAKEQK